MAGAQNERETQPMEDLGPDELMEDLGPDELMEDVVNYGRGFAVEGDVPELDVFGAAVHRHLMRLGCRLNAVGETLDALTFSEVDVSVPDDWECRRRAGAAELGQAGEFVEELQDGLAGWFGAVNQSRLLMLSPELWEIVHGLATQTKSLSPVWVIIQAAVRHLAAAHEPLAIIQKYESERVAAVRAARAAADRANDGVKSRIDDDARATSAANKVVDIDAITLLLRRADAGFASALRSNLADPNARWSKFLAEANVAEDDEAEAESNRPAGVTGQPSGESETTATPKVQCDGVEDKVAVTV